jgi:hypothetical protein
MHTGGLKCDAYEGKGKVIKKKAVVPVVDAGKVEITAICLRPSDLTMRLLF